MQNPKAKQTVKTPVWKRVFNVFVYLFALAGFGIIAAWLIFKLGLTNNKGAVDENWNKEDFIPTVQQRGAAIIKARGASSAASAANAAVDHMRDWALGSNGKWVSMGVYSKGNPYGVDEDLMFAFPITCQNGEWKIVEGLDRDDFSKEMIKKTEQELQGERDAIKDMI